MAQALSEAELLKLVDALADGQWHSGEDLAADSGITRAALAKRMDKLRDWQLDVQAQQGLGYRLSAPLERLNQSSLVRALPGLRVSVANVTDSTNTQMLAAPAEHDPQVLLAEFQTAGRGRRGRQWHSPFAANLYLSLGWSFAQWPTQITTLPLLVGIVGVQVLRGFGLKDAGVKWPNDLWVGGKKLGGILIEHRGEAGGPCRVVIGIGLNVAMTADQAQAVDQPWTSVTQALGKTISRNELARALLSRLVQALHQFEREGFSPFAALWPAVDLSLNRPVQVHAATPYTGIARGIAPDGALRVEVNGAVQSVHSGEVSLRLA